MQTDTKNINSYRKFTRNNHSPDETGDYVLYWMQTNRRFQYNYALEYAVAWANKLGKPLLIYEGLSIDYPWACDRFHAFIMQGMKENIASAKVKKLNFYSYLEPKVGEGKGLFYSLAEKASLVISDEFPVFIIREQNKSVAKKLDIPFITIDSNGLIPLGVTEKDPYSAYLFRKIMQKYFIEAYTNPPKENPLYDLKNTDLITLPEDFLKKYPRANKALADISGTVSKLNINHKVKVIDMDGTRKAALNKLGHFIGNSLMEYDEKRNHPDEKKTSGLSGWLHFGKISEYEIVKAALDLQPKGWDLNSITPNGGKNSGFFNGDPNIESFLDEVITWREVGFHFAHHRPDYDQFESLPDWVQKTMDEHRNDEREYIYSFEEFEQSKTHDELWNAAQTQLREEGIIHNYLRMLWGKKVIEWTPDYRTALDYLIELNNKYAIDGRDPNSYSGIFWVLGRFDRAWQERDVFGKLRYMTSANTRKKVRLNQYLDKYGSQKSFL
ncbi:MAG: deoxyribodipyrimidine photolyase [Balneolaceae bacterium]